MEQRKSAELNDLGRRLDKWREKHGGRGSRIPDELWKDAVQLAKVEGVWASAKALRLNYKALSDRVRQGGSSGVVVKGPRKTGGPAAARARRTEVPPGGKAGERFIAFELGQLGGAGRTVIDFLGRHGDRMRVDVAGGVDLAGLVQTFWSRQP
jgi:hypothetical protein